MPIQFPNFLQAQTQAPDYSGIGDSVENFYKGYNMPKDALIKEIQARFAQPNAEAGLESTKLSNINQSILNKYLPSKEQSSILSTQLGNRKAQMELNEQIDLERQMRAALAGQNPANYMGGGGGAAMPTPIAPSPIPSGGMTTMPNQPGMPRVSPGAPLLPGMPQGLPMPPAVGGMTMVGSPPPAPALQASPVPQSAPIAPTAEAIAPNAQNAPADQAAAPVQPMDEIVIAKGAPQLAGIDAMYDSNPLSRAFLEKKGFKKTQEIKFDNKTGRTTILTKYPSGKVTTQMSNNIASGGDSGFPLTNRMIYKHQNIISSIDNAMPTIQKILKEDKGWEPYPRNSGLLPGMGYVPGWQSQSTKYEALVSSALDSLIGAYGLPSTNEGIDTVKKQLLIGHGETDANYKKRLTGLIEDLKRRKAYSEGEVKRSNKIQPIDTGSAAGSSNEDFSDLHNFDEGGQ